MTPRRTGRFDVARCHPYVSGGVTPLARTQSAGGPTAQTSCALLGLAAVGLGAERALLLALPLLVLLVGHRGGRVHAHRCFSWCANECFYPKRRQRTRAGFI